MWLFDYNYVSADSWDSFAEKINILIALNVSQIFLASNWSAGFEGFRLNQIWISIGWEDSQIVRELRGEEGQYNANYLPPSSNPISFYYFPLGNYSPPLVSYGWQKQATNIVKLPGVRIYQEKNLFTSMENRCMP